MHAVDISIGTCIILHEYKSKTNTAYILSIR